jgi:hypothetical protein
LRDLPSGDYRIAFASIGDGARRAVGSLRVGDGPVVFEGALGRSVPSNTGGSALGLLSLVAGVILDGIGVAGLAFGGDPGFDSTPLGAVSLGIGLVLTVVGIWGALSSGGERHPGSTIERRGANALW